jgi:hypothetical protein
VNAALTQVLEPILEEVKQLAPAGGRVTVIFDRGGYSPKLFARLMETGFDLITYRKGKSRALPRSRFEEHESKVDGRCLRYPLCDQPRVRVGRLRTKRKKRVGDEGPEFVWLRQVTILREHGRQTQILTNRRDLEAVSEEIDRPNPQWSRLDKRVKKAKAEVARLRAELGRQATENEESRRRTVRGFKIAHADLRRQLEQAESRLERLYARRKATAKRIPANDLETLKKEKKLVVDSIKMTAYQVETELFRMLGDHYARTEDEGRTLLHAVFQSPARLEVYEDELHLTIAAQSSPHRTQAVAALCKQLDALRILFPGTNLRLRLAVETPEPLIS